jgi:hypothetical protein
MKTRVVTGLTEAQAERLQRFLEELHRGRPQAWSEQEDYEALALIQRKNVQVQNGETGVRFAHMWSKDADRFKRRRHALLCAMRGNPEMSDIQAVIWDPGHAGQKTAGARAHPGGVGGGAGATPTAMVAQEDARSPFADASPAAWPTEPHQDEQQEGQEGQEGQAEEQEDEDEDEERLVARWTSVGVATHTPALPTPAASAPALHVTQLGRKRAASELELGCSGATRAGRPGRPGDGRAHARALNGGGAAAAGSAGSAAAGGDAAVAGAELLSKGARKRSRGDAQVGAFARQRRPTAEEEEAEELEAAGDEADAATAAAPEAIAAAAAAQLVAESPLVRRWASELQRLALSPSTLSSQQLNLLITTALPRPRPAASRTGSNPTTAPSHPLAARPPSLPAAARLAFPHPTLGKQRAPHLPADEAAQWLLRGRVLSCEYARVYEAAPVAQARFNLLGILYALVKVGASAKDWGWG